MKKTIISHIYNESYLLPWWLNHHKKIFDHGIIIDYNSTDNSVEIIKNICPGWDVIASRNELFSAQQVDQEVMDIENTIDGYKICLNTTEFLVCNGLDDHLEWSGSSCYSIPRATMVDNEPNTKPTYDIPLIDQKYFGFLGNNNINGEFRYLHNYTNGRYHTGRHYTDLKIDNRLPFFILWYGFSPWNESTINRKLQIGGKIPHSDKVAELGFQHLWSREKIESVYMELIPRCVPIKFE